MTNEQAIKELKWVSESPKNRIIAGANKADIYKLAVQALEKQIPKKPNKILKAFEYTFGDCPTCNKGNDINYKHCKYCGQKLDWE